MYRSNQKGLQFCFQIVVLSGPPADRPCLVDFANLITKRLSLLECVNIVKDTIDWKKVETTKANGIQWLKNNNVKAFYSVSRHSNFFVGARCSMELSGLGKMKPNMMLVGFKQNWQTAPASETRDYYKIIKSAFELNLSVGVLRISGGFDLADDDWSSELPVRSEINCWSRSHASVDSGMDEMRDTPPSSSPNSQTPPTSIGERSVAETETRQKSFLNRIIRKDKETEPGLTNSNGREIHNDDVIKTMMQFRSDESDKGFVDVYWLYDDGGLTLLMPYILMTRKKFSKSKLRVFVLSKNDTDVDEETRNMETLLKKFRIQFHQVPINIQLIHWKSHQTLKCKT